MGYRKTGTRDFTKTGKSGPGNLWGPRKTWNQDPSGTIQKPEYGTGSWFSGFWRVPIGSRVPIFQYAYWNVTWTIKGFVLCARIDKDDHIEAVVQRCSINKVFIKISQNFAGKHLYQSLYFGTCVFLWILRNY